MPQGNTILAPARWALAVLAALSIASRLAAGQSVTQTATARGAVLATATTEGATIRGFVHDAIRATPISDVLIQLPGLSRAVRSDSTGRFVLRSVPSGRWQVVFARMGYAPQITTVAVTRDSGTTLDVRLSNKLELAPVQVSAAAQATTPLQAPQAMSVLADETLRQAQST